MFRWFFVVAVCAGVVLGEENKELQTAIEGLPGEVERALQDRKYADALAALEVAAKQKDARLDVLTFFRGVALLRLQKYDDAIAAFGELTRTSPRSPWARKARFSQGQAYAAKGDFRLAHDVYRAEAQSLLADDRKQALADVCLEFADALYQPPQDDVPPDYAAAQAFYERALLVGAKPERRPGIELRIADCDARAGELPSAIERVTRVAHECARDKHPLAVEALFRLGEWQAPIDPFAGRRVWQDLLALHADSPSERLAEAAYRLGQTYDLPTPPTNAALDLGVSALRAFLGRYPDHKFAGDAHLTIARSQAFRGRHADCVATLTAYLADPRHAAREQTPEARHLLAKTLATQQRFAEARAAWREFLDKHPAHRLWSEAQSELINAEYAHVVAHFEAGQRAAPAERAREFEAARRLAAEFQAQHPLEPRGRRLHYLLGQMHYAEADWDRAIAEWRRLVAKHPQTYEASQAQFLIGTVFEEKLDRFEDALREYRRIDDGKFEGFAHERIARLSVRTFTVETARTYRSDETPRVWVRSRNVPRLTVRVYNLDLESFFRQQHSLDVESLDLDLIAPDRSFDFAVANYRPHAELTSRIDVPVPSGAAVVVVSSPTRQATTLVLQSDLDVIVKASHDEVFVFAENLRTNRPWPNARVLVSDGQRIALQGTTNADGVWRATREPSPPNMGTGHVEVFAVAERHMATHSLALPAGERPAGLLPVGRIFTDRPLYRPGQWVHLRGVLRAVDGDRFVVPPRRDFTVRVRDPQNRVLHETAVKLGDFGSWHSAVLLPATAVHGNYSAAVYDDSGREHATQAFAVEAFRLPNLVLTIDVPRTVYFRGEEIEGTVRAAYATGEPLAGAELDCGLGNRDLLLTTDARGEARFRWTTREFDESQNVALDVTSREFGVSESRELFLAARAFELEVRLARPAFLVGDSFEATLVVRDPGGQPVATPLTLEVERRATPTDAARPAAVQRIALAAGADGLGRQTLKLEHAGTYVLRATAVDRFGNLVSGETPVTISGDDDKVRLRIFAERHSYRVGETASVVLHWREAPATALVTFQGARILGHRVITLQTGANRFDLPLTADFAPNFELDVAVMLHAPAPAKSRLPVIDGAVVAFQHATSPFDVERKLNLTLDLPRGPLRPGAELPATLRTTDPLGRPVAAEISLALVERELLRQYESPSLRSVFDVAKRRPQTATGASTTFSFQPETAEIDAALLAEAERQMLAEDDRLIARASPDVGGPAWTFADLMPTHIAASLDGVERPFAVGPGMGEFASKGAAAAPVNIDFPQTALTQLALVASDVPRLDADGVFRHADLSADLGDERRLEARLAEFARQGVRLWPDLPPHETGYWNPAIVTGADGRAVVTLRLPGRSTAWTLVARGITADTLAGDAESSFVARQDLFGELRLPEAFTHGDVAEAGVTIHNAAVEQGRIDIELKMTRGTRTVTERKSLEVRQRGVIETTLPCRLDGASGADDDNVLFELTLTAGDRRDERRRRVPVRPYGVSVSAIASGSAVGDTVVVVRPPDLPLVEPRLQILVGPTVERSLLDVLFAPPTACQAEHAAVPGERASSDLLAGLALRRLLATTREADSPHAIDLDARIRASVVALVRTQDEYGGWNESRASARAVWALGQARRAGYSMDEAVWARAVAWLQSELTRLRVDDDETRAMLLHALTFAGERDFPLANQLHRGRQTLSPLGLAYLGLAFVALDRQVAAAEVLDVLAARPQGADATAELQALVALARVHATPAQAAPAVDELLARRVGQRWSPDRATGPAVLALSEWFGRTKFVGEKYKLAILVNGAPVAELTIDDDRRSHVVDVPADLLHRPDAQHPGPREQRVGFRITGRGRFTYQCVLRGFVPAERVRSTTARWTVTRTYEPGRLRVDGAEVPRGFSALDGNVTPFRNELRQLPVGVEGLVELHVRRAEDAPDRASESDLLVVTEPLPAGVTVVGGSPAGDFERYELSPGQITFFVRSRAAGTVRFAVRGDRPGTYRARPTQVREADHPDRLAVAAPRELTVLPFGSKSADPFRHSPDELLELGLHHAERKEWAEADRHFRALLAAGPLTPDTWRRMAGTLLDVALASPQREQAAADVVRAFEILVEKFPEQQVPFAQLVQVGDAYHTLGEYERSYLVFRGTVEASFLRESRVVGFLAEKGRFLPSLELLRRLVREYPPEGYVAAAEHALAQRLVARGLETKAAKPAAPNEDEPPAVVLEKRRGPELVRHGATLLEAFLAEHPEDPAADRAAFSAAMAWRDAGQFDRARERCTRALATYADSPLADGFRFLLGYCHFALGAHERALALCQQVAESQPVDRATGRRGESPNKWPAVYILGQIHHGLGRTEAAIREYARVQDRFADARQALEQFVRKDLALPELSVFRPGEPVSVELRHRNVTASDVTVYRVDLLKFSLLRRSLGDMTNVRVAGIRPDYDSRVPLGDGRDYRDRTKKLPLLLKDEGAYVVVARADDLYASGLVLITPLTLDVQEDVVSGRVRATVRNVVTERYVAQAQVRVLGTRTGEFVAGETDLRGLFVADAVQGRSLVIARLGAGQYAFHRGAVDLLRSTAADPFGASPLRSPPADPPAAQAGPSLLDGLFGSNAALHQESQQHLDRLYRNTVDDGVGQGAAGFGGFF